MLVIMNADRKLLGVHHLKDRMLFLFKPPNKKESVMLRHIFSVLCTLLSLLAFLGGCGEFTPHQSGNQNGGIVFPTVSTLGDPPALQLPSPPDFVAAAALSNLDPAVYTVNGFLVGPLENEGETITAYEVTVSASDHFYLRYVAADTGQLLDDRTAYHAMADVRGDVPDWTFLAQNYTSCPSGWPLCINPGSIGFYGQGDPNWSGNKLGFSSYTIGNSGCLLTSYNMAALYKKKYKGNPGQFNQLLKDKKCFDGPYIKYTCMGNSIGATHKVIGVDEVWNTIRGGTPVIVFGYEPNWKICHAMLLWGHDGKRYWGKDPVYSWTNQDVPLHLNTGCTDSTFRTLK